MVRTKLQTRYTELSFCEIQEANEVCYWINVTLAWKSSDSEKAKIFAVTMDHKLLESIRTHLATAVVNPLRDIYMEDADITINLKLEEKHQAAKLIAVLAKIEKEFEAMTEGLA